jgi:hypothetical protein
MRANGTPGRVLAALDDRAAGCLDIAHDGLARSTP